MKKYLQNSLGGGALNRCVNLFVSSGSRLSCFTLAEMTVVMLILCIVLAVMAPVMTVRNKSQGGTVSSIWKYVNNSSDAYFGVNQNQRAIIGQNTAAADQKGKLIINSSDSLPDQILFRRNGNTVGRFMANENSIAIGDSTVSDNSIVIGYQAKAADGNSVAIGQQAKTEYGSSVVIGDNTTGTGYDVAIGYNANSGPEAIAIGYNAQTKYGGIVIGVEAKAQSGTEAIAIGGYTNASGSDSVAIGYNATASAQNSVAIGNGAVSDTANTIVLGDSGYTTHIKGNLTVDGILTVNGSVVFPACSSSYSSSKFKMGTYSTYCSGNYVRYSTSDRRLKNVGKEVTTGLDKIKQLKVFNYTYKNDKTKTPQVGVMAQDLQKVFPNAIFKDKDGFLMIRTEDMFYAMINAIKELDAKISVLFNKQSEKDKEIKALKETLVQVQNQNKTLEKRLKALEAKVK